MWNNTFKERKESNRILKHSSKHVVQRAHYPVFHTIVALGNVKDSLAIRTSVSDCCAPGASNTALEAISLPLL